MVGAAVMAHGPRRSQGKTKALFQQRDDRGEPDPCQDVGLEHRDGDGTGVRAASRVRWPYAVPVLIAMLILLAFSWKPGR